MCFLCLYMDVAFKKKILQEVPVLFIPDKETYTIHGKFTPGPAGYPDPFTPDNPAQTSTVYGVQGTMIPDKMTLDNITGGIHGSLTADSFRPDTFGTQMWFNPDAPETKVCLIKVVYFITNK